MPVVTVMLAGIAVVLVRLKLAAVRLAAPAVTVKVPSVLLAVSVGAVAMPLALVLTVAVREPLNAALAPLDGVVNVTLTPFTGLPLASFTVA